MRVYRVHVRANDHESQGYEYFPNLKDAKRAHKEAKKVNCDYEDKIESFDIPTNKKGLIRWLNRYAGYPDNG